jgi:hypothetical protein
MTAHRTQLGARVSAGAELLVHSTTLKDVFDIVDIDDDGFILLNDFILVRSF